MIAERFGRGTKLAAAESGIVAAVGLAFYVVLGRIMPLQELGILSLIVFMVTILGLFMNLSVSSVAVQRISAARAQDKAASIPALVRSSLTAVLALICISATVFALLLFLSPLPPSSQWLLLLAPLISGIGAIRSLFFSFISGFERFGSKSALGVLVFALTKGLGIAIFLWSGAGVWAIMIGWLVAECIGLAACILLGRIPFRGDGRTPIRELIGSGFAVSMMLFLTQILDYSDRAIYFLRVANLASLGTYELTIRLLGPLVSLSAILFAVSLPILSHTFYKNREVTKDFMGTMTRFYLVAFAPACTFLSITLSGQLPSLVYGSGLASMSVVFSILVVAALFQGLTLLAILFLQATGERAILAVIGIPVLVFDFGATWLVAPILGVLGIAVVRLAGYTMASASAYYVLSRRMRLALSIRWTGKLLALSAIIGAVTLLLNSVPLLDTLLLLVETCAAIVLYVVGLRFLHLVSREDRQRLVSAFPFMAHFDFILR